MSKTGYSCALSLILSACSRDYTPNADASGADIYAAACRECHPPANNGSIFLLSPAQNNLDVISTKIRYGSWLMPAFPKLNATQLHEISKFVLDNSDSAED